MKTFKLVSFALNGEQGCQEIPFIDSLIINQENEKKTWLIEVFIEKKHLSPFLDFAPGEEFPVSVIITDRENPPAHLIVSITSLKTMDDYASILMEGKLQRRPDNGEKVLESLIKEGFSGERLLQEFRKRLGMRNLRDKES